MLICFLHPLQNIPILLFYHQIGKLAGTPGIGEELVCASGDALCRQHIAGSILGAISNIDALEAPFLSQNLDLGTVVSGGCRKADSVIAGHNAKAAAIRQGSLKGLKVYLPTGLLCRKSGNAVPVFFLVIHAKVLKAGDDTLFCHWHRIGAAHLITQEAIFGEILTVSSQVSCAVDIRTRAEDHGDSGVHSMQCSFSSAINLSEFSAFSSP